MFDSRSSYKGFHKSSRCVLKKRFQFIVVWRTPLDFGLEESRVGVSLLQLLGVEIVDEATGTMACISEDRIDLIEEKMRSKIDTMTGFSDVEGKSRALEKVRNAGEFIARATELLKFS